MAREAHSGGCQEAGSRGSKYSDFGTDARLGASAWGNTGWPAAAMLAHAMRKCFTSCCHSTGPWAAQSPWSCLWSVRRGNSDLAHCGGSVLSAVSLDDSRALRIFRALPPT
jgi:hypothetical protein